MHDAKADPAWIEGRLVRVGQVWTTVGGEVVPANVGGRTAAESRETEMPWRIPLRDGGVGDSYMSY